MNATEFDLLKLIGKSLFGKPTRMSVGMFCSLHQNQEFTNRKYHEFARQQGWPMAVNLGDEMDQFVTLGMAERTFPRPGAVGGAREYVWYAHVHWLWEIFYPLAKAALPGNVSDQELMAARMHLASMLRSLEP